MPDKIAFPKSIVILVLAAAALFAIGWYTGQKHGYVDGVIKGSEAGFQTASTSILSGKIMSDVRQLPTEQRGLGDALCAGFRSQLPCKSLAEANQLLGASDPVDQMRGQSCQAALHTLGNCGE